MRMLSVVYLLTFLTVVVPSLSQAFTLQFTPTTQTRNVGDAVSVDVVVSGLSTAAAPQIVSTFDLNVNYDAAILGNASVSFASWLGTNYVDSLYDSVITAGIIDFYGISFLSDADLYVLQGGDSVTLATLQFTALTPGTSTLQFDAITDPGIDVKGLIAQKLDFGGSGVINGEVTVVDGGTPAVPEPGTIALVSLGVIGLAFWRRRQE